MNPNIAMQGSFNIFEKWRRARFLNKSRDKCSYVTGRRRSPKWECLTEVVLKFNINVSFYTDA